MKRRLTRVIAVASAVAVCLAAVLWWGQRTSGTYLCELNPVDSWGGYFPLFFEVQSNGAGRIWSPKSNSNDYDVQIQLSESGDGFRMSGDGLYEWRTEETMLQTLSWGFAQVEMTVFATPSRSTNPSPTTLRFEKILFPPAVTPVNLAGFGLLLCPGLLWIAFGLLIDSPKTFKIWHVVTLCGLLAYCILLFLILGFAELFHSVLRYIWMPVVAVPIYIWALSRLRTSFSATHEPKSLFTIR